MTVSVLAADRVTVKVAGRVPVLPSVTVTSPIRSHGACGGGPAPSLSSTETVFEPAFATATSGRPSPLKSPTATVAGDEPAASRRQGEGAVAVAQEHAHGAVPPS